MINFFLKNKKLLLGILTLFTIGIALFVWYTHKPFDTVSSSLLPKDSPPPEVIFDNKVYVPAKCLMPAFTPVKKIGVAKEGFDVFDVIVSPGKDTNILLKHNDGRYQCYIPKLNLEQKEIPSTSVPVHIALNIDRAPRVGETVTITWRVSSDWDAPKIESYLKLPDGIKLVGGTANWQGGLPTGGQQQFSATIKVVEQGVWEIRGEVRTVPYPETGDSWSDIDLLYLTVTATGSKIGLLPLGGDPTRRVQVEQPEGG